MSNSKPNGADKQVVQARKSALTLERISLIQEISAPVSRTLHLIARFENYKTGHICDVGYDKLSDLTGIPESTLRGHVRKLTALNLLERDSPLYKGMYQNHELAVNWRRVIELSQPVEKGILEYFIQRSQMSGGPALTNERYIHKKKRRHKKEYIDSVSSSSDSLRSPQPATDSLPEEDTKGKDRVSLDTVSGYEAKMDRTPLVGDLKVWRDRVFEYWLDSVLELKNANPIDWVTFEPFEKFDRGAVKRMMENFSNRVLEDYDFSPLQCMEFLLRAIRWGDIPKGGHYPTFPSPGMFQKRIGDFSNVVYKARLWSPSLKANVSLEATEVERADYVLANFSLVMREVGLKMDDWGRIESGTTERGR